MSQAEVGQRPNSGSWLPPPPDRWLQAWALPGSQREEAVQVPGLAPGPQVLSGGHVGRRGRELREGCPQAESVKKVSVVSSFISGNNSPFELLG